MTDAERILNDYVKMLSDKIDLLVGIDNKVSYNAEYEKGYNDAANAIKNIVYTVKDQMLRNR